jgi:hypothetical protein
MKYLAMIMLVVAGLGLACSSSTNRNGRGNRGGGNDNAAPNPAEQTPTSTPTPAPTPDPVMAVQKLTVDLGTALAAGNADQLNDLLSDGYLHINDQGQLVTKPDLIAGVKDGSVRFNSVNIQEVNIRVYGDAAVVNATFMGTNAANGSRLNVEDRATFVAAREGDNWRFVSGQTTPMHAVPQNGNSKSGASSTSGGISGAGTGGGGSGTGTGAGPQ